MSEEDYDEGRDEVVGREQCPQCAEDGHDQSGDNLARYADGHAHCYKCSHHEPPTDDGSGTGGVSDRKTRRLEFSPLDKTSRDIRSRRISAKTCSFFGYGIGEDRFGDPVHICDVR